MSKSIPQLISCKKKIVAWLPELVDVVWQVSFLGKISEEIKFIRSTGDWKFWGPDRLTYRLVHVHYTSHVALFYPICSFCLALFEPKMYMSIVLIFGFTKNECTTITKKIVWSVLGFSWIVKSLGSLIFRGLSPEESDLQYLKIAASKLVMFGVDAHPARVWDSFICRFMIDELNWSTGTCNTLHVHESRTRHL